MLIFSRAMAILLSKVNLLVLDTPSQLPRKYHYAIPALRAKARLVAERDGLEQVVYPELQHKTPERNK